MSKEEKSFTRREFISNSIKGAGLVGLGGAAGYVASRFLTGTPEKKSSSVVNVPAYDLSEFSKVSPSLIQYEEAGQITTKFQAPRGVAVGPDDRIYVTAGKTIQIFDKDTTHLSEFRLNDLPRCLTITEDGTIYAGMKDHVEIYDFKGSRKANWESLGENAVLTSIAVSENNVFVADAGNRIIWRYDASGKFVQRIGEKNKARDIPGFAIPSPYFDLAVAPDGLLRVANPGRHRIEAYTYDGDLESSWGKTSMNIDGFCGCCNPVNFAMLPDGRFVTCEKGLPRVKIYNADGVFEGVVAAPSLFTENGRACTLEGLSNCQSGGGLDVAVDSEGRILVLDAIVRNLRIFTRIEGA